MNEAWTTWFLYEKISGDFQETVQVLQVGTDSAVTHSTSNHKMYGNKYQYMSCD